MSSIVHLQRALMALLVLSGACHVHAASFIANGKELIVSGDVVDGDSRKLKEALTPQIRYLILSGPGGTSYDEAMALARTIQSRDLTTVAHGYCGYACSRMFLAGKERMFSGETRPEASYLALGGTFYTNNGGPIVDDYAFVSTQTDLPGKYLRQYMQNREASILIFHPMARTSKGSMLGCGVRAVVPDCAAIVDTDALKAAVITTTDRYFSESFKMPADTDKPEATGFAPLEKSPELPQLSDNCRGKLYESFLKQDKPRAFVVSNKGGCHWVNAQSLRPIKQAMDNCKKAGGDIECRYYAVDDDVVFKPF